MISRGPFLRISEITLHVLTEQHYQIDSSVPARKFQCARGCQRYQKTPASMRFFWAPLVPYYPSPDNLGKRGNSPILEIPPSAYLIPINMKAMRFLGIKAVTWAARPVRQLTPHLVFYAHPFEFVAPEQLSFPSGNNVNLKKVGPHNLSLLARFVEDVLQRGYFSTVISQVKKQQERIWLDGSENTNKTSQ